MNLLESFLLAFSTAISLACVAAYFIHREGKRTEETFWDAILLSQRERIAHLEIMMTMQKVEIDELKKNVLVVTSHGGTPQ